ncbi:predicted protein [Streptomyces sp. AA4]|nr:predicted protein [Streptomyces sp. AA4]
MPRTRGRGRRTRRRGGKGAVHERSPYAGPPQDAGWTYPVQPSARCDARPPVREGHPHELRVPQGSPHDPLAGREGLLEGIRFPQGALHRPLPADAAEMRPNATLVAPDAPNATLGASHAPNATLGRSPLRPTQRPPSRATNRRRCTQPPGAPTPPPTPIQSRPAVRGCLSRHLSRLDKHPRTVSTIKNRGAPRNPDHQQCRPPGRRADRTLNPQPDAAAEDSRPSSHWPQAIP